MRETRNRKIDKLEMMRMLRDGKTGAEIARHFQVSPNAVAEMKKKITEETGQFSPELVNSELGGKTIDALWQLKNMNDTIIEEMKRCQGFIGKEEKAIKTIEDLRKRLFANPNDKDVRQKLMDSLGPTFANILKVQMNVIAIAGEVRKQVELQLKIAETVYSVSMMAEFQEEVIQILKQVDPKARDEVIRRLKERRQIRGLLKG
jgi:hypothetical protein